MKRAILTWISRFEVTQAGTTTRFSYGDDPGYERLSDYAWYGGNSGLRPHPVGQKRPNPWGLYDMLTSLVLITN